MLKTSEERHYGTIHGSALATQIAIRHSRAQANPTVKRGPEHKVRIKKLPKDKANDKLTQTSKGGKQNKRFMKCLHQHRQFCTCVDINNLH